MHELAVTQSLLDIALKHAKGANAVRITDLYLVIGRLSSIIDDSVQFYWDFVAEGTMAEGARLHFTRIPAKFRCNDCGNEFEFVQDILECTECHGTNTTIQAGDEFYLQSIQVDDNQ